MISPDQSIEEARCIFDAATPAGGCIVTGTVAETVATLLRIQQSYVQAESCILSLMLRQEEDQRILRKAETILGYPFALYWKDFRCLYISEELAFMNEESGDIIEKDLGLQLIMDKKFHDVLSYQFPFYYYESYRDLYNYCQNLFSNTTYIARLVLVLPKGCSKLHPGEEEVFSILTDYISSWGKNHSRLFRDSLPNELHTLLTQSVSGIPVENESWNTILNTINWSVNDRYAIQLSVSCR